MSNQTSPADRKTSTSQDANVGGKSVLSSDLKITGDIVSKGSLEVMGVVDGSVTAGALLVSHDGMVKGSISAASVDLRGKMEGKIDSGDLTLRSAAQVVAEVVYTTLSIESGAQVEGTFKRKKA